VKYFKYLILLWSLLPCGVQAQFYNNGAVVKINPGAMVYTSNALSNVAAGVMTNEGRVMTTSNLVNSNAALLQGNGQYHIGGDWINAGIFNADTSTVHFMGAQNSSIQSGSDVFYRVSIDKEVGASVLLSDGMYIDHSLRFVNGPNKLILGDHTLELDSAAAIFGYNPNNFIVTNSTGALLKAVYTGTDFTFPVGFDANTYNPLTITQTGESDLLGIRCLEHALKNGLTGNAFTQEVADLSWHLTEGTPGGSNLVLTAQWSDNDELQGFDRTNCGISKNNGNGWDLTTNQLGAATGTNPYQISRGGVTETGVFAVGASPLFTGIAFEPSEGWQIGELFPNPTAGSGGVVMLPLISPSNLPLKVQLLDISGRDIAYFNLEIVPGSNLLVLNIPVLAAGVYPLKFMAGGHFFFKELVVQ
jgi:hypothetical protein